MRVLRTKEAENLKKRSVHTVRSFFHSSGIEHERRRVETL